MEQRFLRQLDLLPPERLSFGISIIGAGATGSCSAVCLAQMGCSRIQIWDDDIVEEHNLSNQLHLQDMVGELKVESLAALLKQLTGVQVDIKKQRCLPEHTRTQLNEVVVLAVDSMDTRKELWEGLKESLITRLVIDPRLGLDVGRVITVDPHSEEDRAFYEDPERLYPSSEADRLPCHARVIAYAPQVIGALVGRQIKAYANNENWPKEIVFDLLSCYMGRVN